MTELMRALDAEGEAWALWAAAANNDLLRDLAAGLPNKRITWGEGGRKSRLVSGLYDEMQFRAWLGNVHNKATVLHRTYYPLLDGSSGSLPLVHTLHDMWDERASGVRYPRAKLRSRIKRNAMERADVIACVSDYTRSELCDIWPHLGSKAYVISHGVRKISTSPKATGRDRPYFLYVGRRDGYKNFHILIDALSSPKLRDYDLVCFGGGEFSAGEHSLLRHSHLLHRTHQMPGDDDLLAGLYEQSAGLLYPSRYEGFGLPLLEAMIHGCPVVSSPCASLPEVGGNACLYADAHDSEAWVDAMDRLGAMDTMEHLRAQGKVRAAQFSWARTGRQHQELYRRLG